MSFGSSAVFSGVQEAPTMGQGRPERHLPNCSCCQKRKILTSGMEGPLVPELPEKWLTLLMTSLAPGLCIR